MLSSCLIDVFDPVYGTGYVRVKMALRPVFYEEYFSRSIWVGGSQKILGKKGFLRGVFSENTTRQNIAQKKKLEYP